MEFKNQVCNSYLSGRSRAPFQASPVVIAFTPPPALSARRAEPAEILRISALRLVIMRLKDIIGKSLRSHCQRKREPRDKWLTCSDAAKLIFRCWRHREMQMKSRRPMEDVKVPTSKRPLRHLARFILLGIYSGTRAGAIAAASPIPTLGWSYVLYLARRLNLGPALRSSGDAGRGVGKVGAAALDAGHQGADRRLVQAPGDKCCVPQRRRGQWSVAALFARACAPMALDAM